VVRECGIRG